MQLRGEIYREHKHRRTFKCNIGGRDYFVKIHQNAGWREILKDSLRLRKPIVTAKPEWEALQRCQKLGIPSITPAGFGIRGSSPARMESFIITEPLDGYVHLDEVAEQLHALSNRACFRAKRQMIDKLAMITRALHEAGMNHRDLYLCHFMLPEVEVGVGREGSGLHEDESPSHLPSPPVPLPEGEGRRLHLHMIDLHRVQIRKSVPRKWLAKDLAALLFSSLDLPLTSTDFVRFLKRYWGDGWQQKLRQQRRLLRSVIRRAKWMYRRQHERQPRLPAGFSNF